MPENVAQWKSSRQIVERVMVNGKLQLLTPTQIGSGESVGPTDMALLRDPLTGTKALLPGASVAGALRNYLRECEHGYGRPVPDEEAKRSPVVQLFGGRRGDDQGPQSLIIVDDAFGEEAGVQIRDGVRIDSKTGTAAKGAKFDMEVLEAGTAFELHFEVLIPKGRAETLKPTLARALQGFEHGEIALGARKCRGLGQCKVTKWNVETYDMTTTEGLQAWLSEGGTSVESGSDIARLLGVRARSQDKRRHFTMDLTCWLDGSLLVRAAPQAGSDAGHLHALDTSGERMPVLPGTSLAGVLRHRALRIANTLSPVGDGGLLVAAMFGSGPQASEERQPGASRVWVRETKITGARSLVQSRVKIDRFTGGAYPTALFSQEPLFGGPDSRVRVQATLRNPRRREVGLLLLLLKDLWTGDLPVGGENSVGRGRLRGIAAKLHWKDHALDLNETWTLSRAEDGLKIPEEAREPLENAVSALKSYFEGGS